MKINLKSMTKVNSNNREEGVLDDYSEIRKIKKVNYTRYTVTYVLLMILIGGLLTKLLMGPDIGYSRQFLGACAYVLIAVFLFGLKTIASFILRSIRKKQLVIEHPAWFYVLEGVFSMWCVVIMLNFITYMLKFDINPFN